MAGIGFELRKLYRRDNLSGLLLAYANAVLASTGPWVFTVLALAGIIMFSGHTEALTDFKSVVIYNFCFSLVLASPFFTIVTRYVSDCIHRKDVSTVPGAMIGALTLFNVLALPVAGIFYFRFTNLPDQTALAAMMGFILIGMIWVIGMFITALKDYRSITLAFLMGMVIAVISACSLFFHFGATGLLSGFNIGLGLIIAMLVERVYSEYPYPLRRPFAFLPYFRTHWDIALGGLLYNSAVWVDKWIMWTSEQAQRLPNGLIMYPHYDSAMFLAYLTIIPAMAVFLFSIETNFFEHYLRFYRDIQNKATYQRIYKNHHSLIASILGSAMPFMLMQTCICVMAIVMAPEIIVLVHGDYLQIGIFRYGVLGVLFHAMVLFLLILLSYFDSHREALLVYAFFLLTNALFTWISLQLGFAYYGYGYFLASFLTFLLVAFQTMRHVRQLPYHAFITTNTSVR